MSNRPTESFAALISTMHRLRAPGGCPWDAEQTHASLRPYAIEEAYEVCEAIDRGDDADLADELGDLLLQVVFHAELAAERAAFSITDVVDGLVAKLVRRHPHVFGNEPATTSAEVVANWARIKARERSRHGGAADAPSSALNGVPHGLPSLLRAHRLGQKAGAVGFDWQSPAAAREKLTEELAELDDAIETGDDASIGAEIGDLLFAVSSYARQRGLNAEMLLHGSLDRFERRFELMETDLTARGTAVDAESPASLDAAWQRAKQLAASVKGD